MKFLTPHNKTNKKKPQIITSKPIGAYVFLHVTNLDLSIQSQKIVKIALYVDGFVLRHLEMTILPSSVTINYHSLVTDS